MHHVSVEEVMERTGLPRSLVVLVFKAIAASSVVDFRKGANGHQSRLEFCVHCRLVIPAEAAKRLRAGTGQRTQDGPGRRASGEPGQALGRVAPVFRLGLRPSGRSS